jgi:hypothetical protein
VPANTERGDVPRYESLKFGWRDWIARSNSGASLTLKPRMRTAHLSQARDKETPGSHRDAAR